MKYWPWHIKLIVIFSLLGIAALILTACGHCIDNPRTFTCVYGG